MAIEPKRGCGYRKVGGLYLVGSGLGQPCDRLPFEIIPCPTCGEEPPFHRGISSVMPHQLLDGPHIVGGRPCNELDPVCDPPGRGWLMWVGNE